MTTPSSSPRRFVAPGFRCLVARDFEPGVRAAGLHVPQGLDVALEAATRTRGGRGPNWLVAGEGWPGRVRLRPLRHGGALGRWLGARFLSPRRCEREFRITRMLRERGAPIPVAALTLSRRRGPFWRPMLGTLNRETARDARAWLGTETDGPRPLEPLAREIARSLRRFHDAGAEHGDLHLGNVLLESTPTGPRAWLVDLDRTVLHRRITTRQRMRDCMRLWRSIEKAGREDWLHPRLQAAFLAGYCDGDRALRQGLLEAGRRELRRLRRHRLGWRLRRGWLAAGVGALLLAPGDGLAGGSAVPADPPPRLSLLATGDTGSTRRFAPLFEGQLAVAHALAEEDRARPVDALVLLGDNFYWHGLGRSELVKRLRTNLVGPYCHFLALGGPRSAEVEDACTIPRRLRHPVPVFAVLGNHDLELPESARLQREVVPEFVPAWTMSPGLARTIELGEGVSLVLFESEVAIDDRDAIHAALVEAIRGARGPWRIVATHRPVATDDLGGVPLGGYPAFVRDAIADSGRPVQLVLAAHHHSLQAFALEEPSRLLQIGVGSGSRAGPPLAQDPPGSLFGALDLGFARVDLIGRGDRERLAVSLFSTARWPLLARMSRHAHRARFEVDLDGGVTTPSTGTESH